MKSRIDSIRCYEFYVENVSQYQRSVIINTRFSEIAADGGDVEPQ